MAQDKLRKHIRQIIKEELNTQNEIFGLGKVTMDDVKKKLENMINGMDANGKSKIQTPMNSIYKDSLRDFIKTYIDPVINDGEDAKFTPRGIDNNIIGYDGRRTAAAIIDMVNQSLETNLVNKKKGFGAATAALRVSEEKENIDETWYRMKVLAGVIK